jgi:hypothetical protein
MIYPSDFSNGFDEKRVELVRTIFKMLKVDYGPTFKSQFKTAEDARLWGCRLLEISAKHTDETLINAVDNLGKLCHDFPPNLNLIQSEMDRLRLESLKAARDAETLARMSIPVNPEGHARMAGMMNDLGEKLKAPLGGVDSEEWLDKLIAYECAVWTVNPDKTMPFTRSQCDRMHERNPDGPTPGKIAAHAALRVGGDTLSMFKQIASFQ